ncbi:FAD-binding oxidoreductase [Streptomyces sp. NPDC053367]|uniref:FAD-binding oxidoreductase n=1 Tax=Streptomyces sp. NPDC053367 TaxID=3365700 RepID=UPI0037D5F847
MTENRSEGGALDTAAQTLRRHVKGTVSLPGEDVYDTERAAWNLRIDAHPAVVVRAADADDVRTAVRTAREHSLPLAVQSTGHGTLRPSDGGVLVKTGALNSVDVDPVRRVARVGTGALWSDVIAAAAPHGLAPLSGTPSVGVTGYTLGGGIGWLSRRHGLASDSLLSAELVTADGEFTVASAEENPGLLWALRGGSGNFGVVTSMEIALYPVGPVFAGMSLYPADRAPEVFRRYTEWAAGEPDGFNTAVLLLQMPPLPMVPEPVRGKRVLAVRVFSEGSEEEARRELAPVLAAAGDPLLPGFGEMDFARAGVAITGPPPPPMAARQHFDHFRELPGDAVDAIVKEAGEGSDPAISAVELRHWGGAIARTDQHTGPAGHRDADFSVIVTAMFDGVQDRAQQEERVGELAALLRPYAHGGKFLNFLSDLSLTHAAFTPENHARLVEAKRRWDPDNFFRLNHNIAPH